MAKRRLKRLKGIVVDEVSLVDRPANQKPFLFFKSADGTTEIEKQSGLDLAFKTDLTIDGTSVSINGKRITNLTGLNLWVSPDGDDKVNVSCGYTVAAKGESNGGFKSSRTYTLDTNLPVPYEQAVIKASNEDLETVRLIAPDVSDDADGPLVAHLAKAIDSIVVYKDDMPPALIEAVGVIVKLATSTEEEVLLEKDEDVTDTKETPAVEAVKPAETPATPADNTALAIEVGKLTALLGGMPDQIKTAVDEAVEAKMAKPAVEPAPVEAPAETPAETPADDAEELLVEVDEDTLANEAMQEALLEAAVAAST